MDIANSRIILSLNSQYSNDKSEVWLYNVPRFRTQNCGVLTCNSAKSTNMPGPSNTLLTEGSFEELADELAHYIDEIRKKQNDGATVVQAEITPLLEQGQKDEALKKLVIGSSALNGAPEKGMISGFGLYLKRLF